MTIHVPPQWTSRATGRIAFIGEAPSTEEIEHDPPTPLVGPSGRIFNSQLRTANLDRQAHWVGNVFDEQIPGNDLAAAGWLAPADEAKAGGFADLPPIGKQGYLRPEYRWHLERLKGELEDALPTVIVPLGGTALWALTGDSGIAARRGAVQPATLLRPGAKLLPTYHPALSIHQWHLFHVTVGDLIKARREWEIGPEIVYPKRALVLDPSISDLRAYTPRIEASELLSVDIETGWGQMTSIGFAPDQENAIVIPFTDRRQADRSYWRSPEEEQEALLIAKAWCETGVPKVGQFAGTYDAYWLWVKYGIALRNYRDDTRLMHHAIYPELPKDLAFLGAAYTHQGPWKIMGHRSKRDD